MDPWDVTAFSDNIKAKLLSLESVARAGCIMAFYSYRNEPQMLEFMRECIIRGKRIALPCVTGEGKMVAVGYNPDTEMRNNVYGIPEPIIDNKTKLEQPDIVIVPGIAFDVRLNRIGFGGGYYDRFLEGTDAYKIGACFDYQIIEDIDAENHDVPMDIIVTEKRIIGVF